MQNTPTPPNNDSQRRKLCFFLGIFAPLRQLFCWAEWRVNVSWAVGWAPAKQASRLNDFLEVLAA